MRICAFPPPRPRSLFSFSLSLLAVLVAGSTFCRFFDAGLCSMNNNQQPVKVQLGASLRIITARCTQATIGGFPPTITCRAIKINFSAVKAATPA